jgi:protein-S-isoprenylcysteine O-methyltransferase Ste14
VTATVADALTLLGALVVVIGGTCGYWAWRDARDRALIRKREAEIADALQRNWQQARDRYTTEREGAPE